MLTNTELAGAQAAVSGPAAVSVGPRTFILKPPSIEDYGAMLKEMRRQVMATSRDPIEAINERIAAAEKAGRPFSPTVVKALVESAIASSTAKDAKAEPSMDQLTAQMQTLDGLRWWVGYLVKKADPSVTAADIAGWIPDDATAFRVSAEVGRLSEHQAFHPN